MGKRLHAILPGDPLLQDRMEKAGNAMDCSIMQSCGGTMASHSLTETRKTVNPELKISTPYLGACKGHGVLHRPKLRRHDRIAHPVQSSRQTHDATIGDPRRQEARPVALQGFLIALACGASSTDLKDAELVVGMLVIGAMTRHATRGSNRLPHHLIDHVRHSDQPTRCALSAAGVHGESLLMYASAHPCIAALRSRAAAQPTPPRPRQSCASEVSCLCLEQRSD